MLNLDCQGRLIGEDMNRENQILGCLKSVALAGRSDHVPIPIINLV
jgi:hypothetical protein